MMIPLVAEKERETERQTDRQRDRKIKNNLNQLCVMIPLVGNVSQWKRVEVVERDL
jgi:hypothetical protein